MLDAGKFSIIVIIIIVNVILYKYLIEKYLVKINMAREQSAAVKINKESNLFEAVQRLNARNLYIFKNKINTINDFYAYFVGLIEGDGWFIISKKGKYLLYELGLEMHSRDIQLLYKLNKILGVGVIKIRKTRNTVIYSIRDKKDLKRIILPIFDKYSMLTNKQYDYLRFRDNIMNEVYLYDQLDLNIKIPSKSRNSVEDILSKEYFTSWLIGFIEAEGSFSIYKPSDSKEKIAAFEISQTNGCEVIEAIRQYFFISANVYIDKTGNSRIKTVSIRGIENIIFLINSNRVKLLGYKRLQFILFLKELKTIDRYKKINIPNNY